MIRYTLKCSTGHSFESWFASSTAFDDLRDAGRLECAVCGGRSLDRALMAPRVRTARSATEPDVPAADTAPRQSLSAPSDSKLARLIRAVRKQVERETEDVGRNFVHEARAIHTGQAPERAIRGEADPREARRLVEEGISVIPLPFMDSKKAN
ncbi:DUF1178 family protein [Meridianimarinicoccus sp. RP-17]|uniref:DUF1178 family protein n=1 Tax=Meridianimarinicoccus zhengii TaxID=2056810 RepID=UPI000DAEB5FF|nr:DUF1178 family protein [Phycocomes zhengii]